MKIKNVVLGILFASFLYICGMSIAEQGDYATLGYDTPNGYSLWRVNSTGEFVPGADDTFDIGTSALQVKDIYVDGVAYLDAAEITALSGDVAVSGTFTLVSLSSTAIAAYTFKVGELVYNSTRYAVCVGTSVTGAGSAIFQSSNPITTAGISCKE